MLSRLFLLTMSTSLWVTGIANSLSGEEQQTDQTDIAQSISYFTQIRPILQASCQGCHQPAKSQGDYVMTSFDAMVAGGESGEVAIEPGDPSASLLMARITPVDGEDSLDDPVVAEDGGQQYPEQREDEPSHLRDDRSRSNDGPRERGRSRASRSRRCCSAFLASAALRSSSFLRVSSSLRRASASLR